MPFNLCNLRLDMIERKAVLLTIVIYVGVRITKDNTIANIFLEITCQYKMELSFWVVIKQVASTCAESLPRY